VARLRNVWFWLLAASVIAVGVVGAPSLYRTAVLGSGFMAQLLCSFVSHCDPQAILSEDMAGPGYELLQRTQSGPSRGAHLYDPAI
jgi:hypothetical protein